MTAFERRSVWTTTAGTLVTGLVYWWMKEVMVSTDPWSVVNHPLQPWVLKAHILIAPFQVFSVGLITSRHIWRHYQLGIRKGRGSGLTAAASFLFLVVSGYLLQVVTAETLLRALAWLHLGLGVVYSVGIALHRPAAGGGRPAVDTVRAPGAPAHERTGSPPEFPGGRSGARRDEVLGGVEE